MPKSRSFHLTPLILWILLLLLILSLFLNIFLAHQLYNGSIVATVFDGDSFELADGRRVRLMGVDAPETGRCLAAEAKEKLSSLILGKKVRIKNTVVDDYGRLVSNVIVEDWKSWTKYITWYFSRILDKNIPFFDPMVNRAMVASGLAKNMSTTSPYKQAIDEASADAKKRGLGIYSIQCRSLLPPSTCVIKGNLSQEGKFYYLPSCSVYPQVIVDLSFGDSWFCSESQAKLSGFSLSKACR